MPPPGQELASSSAALVSPASGWTSSYGTGGASAGAGVDFAGDINRDGFKDVIIGAVGGGADSLGSDRPGRAYIAFGSANGLPATPSITLAPPPPTSVLANFGQIVKGLGDVNGDGFDDVAVVAFKTVSTGGTQVVYLYLGTAAGLAATPAWSWTPAAATTQLRLAAGKINGDAFADLVISDTNFANGSNLRSGRVYVFRGQSGSTGFQAPLTINTLNQAEGRFGQSIAIADLNKDGIGDLLVGADNYGGTGAQHGIGRAYLFNGPITASGQAPSWQVTGEQQDAHFGAAISAGDVNCDGNVDVLVGTPDYDWSFFGPVATDAGRIDAFYATSAGPATAASMVSLGLASNLHYGVLLTAQSDFDADGCNDLVVGVRDEAASLGFEGRVYIHRGAVDGPPFEAQTLDLADQSGAGFGAALSVRAGDLNKDGVNDLVIGAPDFYISSVRRGKVWVLRGRKDADRDNVIDVNDGFGGPYDNCPARANPNQADGDGDGKGDACECDGVTCNPSDGCHVAGVCQLVAGNASCTNPVAPQCMVPPTWPTGAELTLTALTQTSAAVSWPAATHPMQVTGYRVLRDGASVATLDAAARSYTFTGLTAGTGYTFKVEAFDELGDQSSNGPSLLTTTPMPPAPNMPSVPATTPTSIGQLAEGIYSGPGARQTNLDPAVLDPTHVSIIRGRVIAPDHTPLAGVSVRLLGGEEFGSTTTDAQGYYDLVVNGGGLLTVVYEAGGRPSLQRTTEVRWNDWVVVDDAVMIPYDPLVNNLQLGAGAGAQWIDGPTTTDSDGARTPRLFVPAGTTATMSLPTGASVPLGGATHVRATEYTVGADGPKAMAATLPAQTGYTYMLEWSIDEAVAAGATSVDFSNPLIMYLDDFIGFPVEAQNKVPAGYYDRESGRWVPGSQGSILQILGKDTGGNAIVDYTGDGLADAPAGLGMTPAELGYVGARYPQGTRLWRVALAHFTPWDCNWPFYAPDDAKDPDTNVKERKSRDKDCKQNGSIIECGEQLLGEEIPIFGTPFSLHYNSMRAFGRSANRKVELELTGDTVPASLLRIEVDVDVAGKHLHSVYPAAPHQKASMIWDGTDVYGRRVNGTMNANIRVAWVYPGSYRRGGTFGSREGNGAGTSGPIGNGTRFDRDAAECYRYAYYKQPVGAMLNGAAQGLGGWSITPQHTKDPVRGRIFFGDSTRRTDPGVGATSALVRVAGGGANDDNAWRGDGLDARLYTIFALAADRLGNVYVLDNSSRLQKLDGQRQFRTFVDLRNLLGNNGPFKGLAVQDDDHLLISGENRVWRYDLVTGTATIFAGSGGTVDGEDIDARSALIPGIEDIEAGPDGSVYVVCANPTSGRRRIRQIDTQGKIRTITELDPTQPDPDTPTQIEDITVANTGAIYACDSYAKKLFVLSADAGWEHKAGRGGVWSAGATDGQDGAGAEDGWLNGCVSVVQDKWHPRVFVADNNLQTIRMVQDSMLETFVGEWGIGNKGSQPFEMPIDGISNLAFLPDGRLVFSASIYPDGVHPEISIMVQADRPPVAGDGSQIYDFDQLGRHVHTRNALTGVTEFTFQYTAGGWLQSITDADGLVTTIERDPTTQKPTGILSPFGQRTVLETNPDGLLSRVTNPASESVSMTYYPGDLLASFTHADSRGAPETSTFEYDSEGRLTKDTSPRGYKTLTRSETATKDTVTVTTAMNRVVTYGRQFLDNGHELLTSVDALGLVSSTEESPSGTIITTTPANVRTTTTLSADPRFGMRAPYASSTTVETPNLPTLFGTKRRQVVLADRDDPTSLVTFKETTTINGKTSTSLYTKATRTAVSTSPTGRTTTTSYDTKGRPVQVDVPGLFSEVTTYDPQGRVHTVSVGTRTTTYDYGPDGLVQTATDAAGRVTSFVRDAVGRVRFTYRPDGSATEARYYPNGSLKSILPPGRPEHVFTYNDMDEPETSTPPAVPGDTSHLQHSYSTDGDLELTTLPEGSLVDPVYDLHGRLESVQTSEGALSVSYDATGQVSHLQHTTDGALDFTYYGATPHTMTWLRPSGSVLGTVELDYDADLELDLVKVGTQSYDFDRDDDGLVTRAGAMSVGRDPRYGFVTSTSLGRVSDVNTWNGYGELDTYVAKLDSTPFLSVGYTYDALGRIDTRTEGIGGVTTVYDYDYDDVGRLHIVRVNGVETARYEYDANGNRQSVTRSGVAESASYDARDRLSTYGGRVYQHGPNGDVTQVTEGSAITSVGYDSTGHLRFVGKPGVNVEYELDPAGRRIGKKLNGVRVQGFLYLDGLHPVAELDGAGQVVSFFVYGKGAHVPEYMVRGGQTYRILTDHLGSPRLVVNTSSGAIVQRVDYDEFGRVTSETGTAGFQPFGFAGGLRDRDTGWTQFGYRDYDPVVGRWMTADPRGFDGGDTNLYAYAANEPVNVLDPNGLESSLWSDQGGNFALGFLDHYSGNTTRWLRQKLGMDDLTDYCSDAYHYGDIAGFVVDLIDLAHLALSLPRLFEDGLRLLDNVADLMARACSFAPGTTVWTESGPRPIEEIRPGDKVWGVDQTSGELRLGAVNATFATPHSDLVELELASADGGTERILVSANHPVYVDGRGWVPVGEVELGTKLTTGTGDHVVVVAATTVPGDWVAYNLDVQDHTYIVGQDGLLVHNACKLNPFNLLKGGETVVYIGYDLVSKLPAYVGIAKDFAVREKQWADTYKLVEIARVPTRGMARAIEEAIIVAQGANFGNIIHSINPARQGYEAARAMGESFLMSNGLSRWLGR